MRGIMSKILNRSGWLLVFLLAPIAGASAQTISLTAHILGFTNVPQNNSDAFGEGQFTYDTATRQLDYYVTYDGIAPTKIDIHGPAAMGEAAASVANIPVSETPVTGKV